jgi:hypothetical protein
MKVNSTLILLASLFSQTLLFPACSKSHSSSEFEMPKALQEKSFLSDFSSYGRTRERNLVDELFDEIREKRADIASIADDFEAKRKRLAEELELLYENDRKSNEYYQDAGFLLDRMKDKLIAEEMRQVLERSKESWMNRVANRDVLAEKLRENQSQIEDQYSALKIRLTLPQIEAYHKEVSTPLSSGTDFEKEQRELIQKLKQFEPK